MICTSCSSFEDNESGRRFVSLEYSEEGKKERNIYGMFYPADYYASCDLVKEFLNNGEVVDIEYEGNGKLRDVDPNEHDLLINDLNKLNLVKSNNEQTKFFIRIFDRNSNLLKKEGFLDLENKEHKEITLRIKNLCQTQWPPPS